MSWTRGRGNDVFNVIDVTSAINVDVLTCFVRINNCLILSSVLRSGLVRFFCYFWTNRNSNRLPNTEIQKKPDRNRKKPQKTGPNQFERNQLKLIKTDQNQYFSSIY